MTKLQNKFYVVCSKCLFHLTDVTMYQNDTDMSWSIDTSESGCHCDDEGSQNWTIQNESGQFVE